MKLPAQQHRHGGGTAFSCNEAISIIENAGLMGLPIPAAVTKAIDVLKQRAEELPDQMQEKNK